ncbi:MAG: M20/M25/M40 family metallo-hydrolase [Deltaproteobacteria bacterium]|nr:M20/M25/M40 family metallo-hydrolase [Deltaproteobacteria bacterium]
MSGMDDIKDRVQREIRADRLVELARAVCDVHSPTGQEAEVARLLQSLMRGLGMRAELQEVEEGRFNVIGVWEGKGGGKTLMFNGHMDTSYPFMLGGSGRSGMLERPLPSKVVGEWVYGTGVDNMKSAFACYLGAVEALKGAGVRLAGDVIITGVVGEVEGSSVGQYHGAGYRGFGHGTRYLIAHGGMADYCLIGEPSNLRLGLGNCGAVWTKITTHGPVMGSYRSSWENSAIRRAVRVMEELQSWRGGYLARNRHPDVELAMSISAIEGGWPWRVSRSAGHCSVYVDVRTLPSQPIYPVMRELKELVRSVDGKEEVHRSEVDFYATIPGSEIGMEAEIVQAVRQAHLAVHGKEPTARFSQATNDAAHLRRYGVPSLIYGPGGARMPDSQEEIGECVRIGNLVDCAKVYALSALDLCNRRA